MADLMEMRREILKAAYKLPPGYQRVEYLETPYRAEGKAMIDTGVPGNNNALKITLSYMAIERQSYGRILGSWNSENNACWRIIQNGGTDETRYFVVTANNRRAGSSNGLLSVPTGENIIDHKVFFELEYGKVTATCGTFTQTIYPTGDGSDVSNSNLIIGDRWAGDTTNLCVKGRFYDHFHIWNGSKLIRDYVPCYRKSDSKPGFFDIVNHTFNPSIGSKDFIPGPEVSLWT